jgi:hypothetical protein
MKVLTVLILICLLAVPHSVIGPRQSRSSMHAAEQAWPSFFASFRRAVRARDRNRLRSMLAPDLLFSLGHHRSDHLDEAFEYWDADNGRGWKAFNRILNQGAIRKQPGGIMGPNPQDRAELLLQQRIGESILIKSGLAGMQSSNFEKMVIGTVRYFKSAVIDCAIQQALGADSP